MQYQIIPIIGDSFNNDNDSYSFNKKKDIKVVLQKRYPLNKEQITFFKKRQKAHEEKVKRNAARIASKFPNISGDLLYDVDAHDKSKWESNEYFGYVWLTSVMNLDYDYPAKELENFADECWKHHYTVNDHHPEYWIRSSGLEKMSNVALAHMVADWASMSQEFNTSLINWYKNTACKKFKFNDNQKSLIEKYISVFPELK